MSRMTIEALAWALVHFVWQGAAVALAAGLVRAAMGRARPQARHAVLCIALLVMTLAPLVTFATLATAGPGGAAAWTPASARPFVPAPAPGSSAPSPGGPADGLLWVVRIWLCGVAILGFRSFGGWVMAQRLARRHVGPVARSVEDASRELCARLGIRRPVRILASAAAEVPAAIGWLRPVVLLPVSALTALTPRQIELLIVHELAHVRRYDYLVNLLQTAVETVLFYHPAVWWVSGQIRIEREHCCDDRAVAACGDALGYARTLASLEGLRTRPPALEVAADGGSLLARIRRLSGRDVRTRPLPPAWLGALVPTALVLTTMLSVAQPDVVAESMGFLRGLADAGYTKLSVEDIIALKENGVEPQFIKPMLSAGLGTPSVEQLIRLRTHGVSPDFVAAVSKSGLVQSLDVENAIRLRENGVDPADMSLIRGLGFGPYPAADVIRLRQAGADTRTFQALREMGLDRATPQEAIEASENGITPERVRSMKRQGFNNLTLEQVVKLSRGGVI